MTIPREIRYDRTTRDFAMYLDGELKGFAATYHQAEVALDEMVLDLCEQGLIDATDLPWPLPGDSDPPGGDGVPEGAQMVVA